MSLLLLLTACANPDCSPAFTVDADGVCRFDEAAVHDLVVNLAEAPLVQVNEDTFVQTIGTVIERNVYISEAEVPDSDLDTLTLYRRVDPMDGYQRLAHDFPVGTVLVHEAVDREEGHGVAVKVADHEDPVNGSHWWYGKIFDDGTDDTNQCTPCGACHSREGTDFVWGVPAEVLR